LELKVLSGVPVPNPSSGGPLSFAVQLGGGAEWIQVELYSPAYALIQRQRVSGPFAASWATVLLPSDGLPVGMVFYSIRCGRGSEESPRITGKLYRLP
jgi:hypothetical protein